MERKIFTGIHDVDREILYNVPDKELYAVCLSSKYAQEVCNETFWHNKFIQEFGLSLGNYADDTYAHLYKKLKPLSNNKLLIYAARHGYFPLIKNLIKDINFSTGRLEKALLYAAINNHEKIIKYLVRNTEINIPPKIGFYAGLNGNINIILYMFKKGINPKDIILGIIQRGDLILLKD
jgi:hypothetical protein